MKILLASDLHIEFHQPVDIPDVDVDLVVLAGDIHKSTLAIPVAEQYRDRLEAPVLMIAGNHEYYEGEYPRVLANLRSAAAASSDIHFLENNCLILDDIRFLGCTLWSNFSLYEEITDQSMALAEQYINDFRLIRHGDQPMTPEIMAALYRQSYAWLEQELAKVITERTVVITHFAPHPAAIHPRYQAQGRDPLTPYFTQDCSQLIRDYRIDVWMYGHTHNSVDTVIEGKTRLVSNQRGYPGESPNYVQYQRAKIIEI